MAPLSEAECRHQEARPVLSRDDTSTGSKQQIAPESILRTTALARLDFGRSVGVGEGVRSRSMDAPILITVLAFGLSAAGAVRAVWRYRRLLRKLGGRIRTDGDLEVIRQAMVNEMRFAPEAPSSARGEAASARRTLPSQTFLGSS